MQKKKKWYEQFSNMFSFEGPFKPVYCYNVLLQCMEMHHTHINITVTWVVTKSKCFATHTTVVVHCVSKNGAGPVWCIGSSFNCFELLMN